MFKIDLLKTFIVYFAGIIILSSLSMIFDSRFPLILFLVLFAFNYIISIFLLMKTSWKKSLKYKTIVFPSAIIFYIITGYLLIMFYFLNTSKEL